MWQSPFYLLIRNDNPDKGTETVISQSSVMTLLVRLEMITPIRGRKLFMRATVSSSSKSIRNDNPDKGTETDFYV